MLSAKFELRKSNLAVNPYQDIINKRGSLPKISVITPTLNQGRYIEHTIQSILEQAYPNYEHIVIDGGSTDNTLDVLRKYPHLKWISEKDKGQADALNKGIALATGEIIAWINSDDYYCPNAFYTIVNAFETMPHAKIIVGRTLLFFESMMLSSVSRNRELTFEEMIRFWDDWVPPAQPSVLFRADILDEVGLFDTSLHYTMDQDMWLRMSLKHVFYCIPDVLTVYRFHENSKSGFANWSRFFPEYNAVYRRYKKHSAILPEGPLATLAIPLSSEDHNRSEWHIQKYKNLFTHLASQKIYDIEAIVITDIDDSQDLLNLIGLPFPVRFIRVPTLAPMTFYQAMTENAKGFAIHCPSIDYVFDIDWFSTALTLLLTNKDIPFNIADTAQATIPILYGINTHILSGIGMPDRYQEPSAPALPYMLIRRDFLKDPTPFEYQQHDAPLITFIVSVNEEVSPLLYLGLFSLNEQCVYPYEVLCVVERDQTADYIRRICNAAVFEVKSSEERFSVLNDAARSAKGRYVFFMSSTIFLTPTSLSAIVETFAEHPRAGIVGGKTVYPLGGIDNAACILFADGTSMKYDYGRPTQYRNCEYLREVDFFPIDFFAVRMQAWIEANGFDTINSPQSFQEADLCFTVRGLGYSVFYQPEAEVLDYNHSKFISSKNNISEYVLTTPELKDFTHFKKKWQKHLQDSVRAFDTSLLERASVSGNRPWILFLCHKLPLKDSPDKGIFLLIESFRISGFNVAIHTEETSFTEDHRWLIRQGIKLVYNDVNFYDFINNNVRHFDAIWLEDRSMALYRSTIIRRVTDSMILIYDATGITPEEDASCASLSCVDVSNNIRIQIARDKLIVKMVDVVYTASDKHGNYLSSLNQDLKVMGNRPQQPALDVLELMKASVYKRVVCGDTTHGFLEILRLEDAIKEIAYSEFHKILDNCMGRPLYIWGAGAGGIKTHRMLASLGASTTAFLDRSPDKWLTTVDGLPVYNPVATLSPGVQKTNAFVVIGSIYSSAIADELIKLGYENKKDFAINLLL
ncbi:MAG: glycosyltransferase [Nitrospirae bacterium]|nr:glycosyltransferase [Nitrospirota bacterium]